MNTSPTVEIHRKNCWGITLYADGCMVIASYYLAPKPNLYFVMFHPDDDYNPDIENLLPKYVFNMYLEMVASHPEIFQPVDVEEELSWL